MFKGLVDYFQFIKRRLEFTCAYNNPCAIDREPSYMIQNVEAPKMDFEVVVKKREVPKPVVETPIIETNRLRKSRYKSRNALSSAYQSSFRSNRNHLLLKHEKYDDQSGKNDLMIIKKLTVKQKEQLKKHSDYIRLEEEKKLKIVDGSVIEQTKMIMTIIRNLIGSTFNEKIVYNDRKLLNILYDILLYNNDSELDKLALENFSIISR